MTLIESSKQNQLENNPIVEKKQEKEETKVEDTHHKHNGGYYENDNYTLQQRNEDGLLQNLGCSRDDDFLTNFTNCGGNISVENSTDVHFGDKNIYQGPVTIKQIVYANGSAHINNNINNSTSSVLINDDYDDEVDRVSIDEISNNNRIDGMGGYNIKANDKFKEFKSTSAAAAATTNQTVPLSRMRKTLIRLEKYVKRKPLHISSLLTLIALILIVITAVATLNYLPNKQIIREDNVLGPAIIKSDDYDPDITPQQINASKLRIASRFEWVAQPPAKATEQLITPVPYVIIHQTATENCSSHAQCVLHVRYLQTFDIESKGFADIGYNFLVGGDGAVYEGRGWKIQGDRYYDYNSQSILIAFIGTFNSIKPTSIQTVTCQKLIRTGVELGYIKIKYKLLIDKSVTKINNSALYNEIKSWPQWVNNV